MSRRWACQLAAAWVRQPALCRGRWCPSALAAPSITPPCQPLTARYHSERRLAPTSASAASLTQRPSSPAGVLTHSSRSIGGAAATSAPASSLTLVSTAQSWDPAAAGTGGDDRQFTSHLRGARSVSELQSRLQSRPDGAVNAVHVAAALSCLARLVLPPAVGQHTRQAASEAGTATSGDEAEALLRHLMRKVSTQAGRFPLRALAISSQNIAKLCRPGRPRSLLRTAQPAELAALFSALAAGASARLDRCPPRELATLLWAIAAAGQAGASAGIFRAAEAVLSRHPRDSGGFNGVDIVNIVWAFGKAADGRRHAFPAAFDALGAHAAPLVRSDALSDGQMSTLVGAYAAAGHPAPELLRDIEAQTAGRLGGFPPSALANLACGFAKLQRPRDTSLTAATGGAVPALVLEPGFGAHEEDGRSDDHTNPTAGALQASPLPGFPFTEIEELVTQQGACLLGKFEPRALAQLVWALAEGGCRQPRVYGEVEQELARRGYRCLSPRDVAMAATGFGTAQQWRSPFFARLGDRLATRGAWQGFRPQELSTTLWAFAAQRRRCAPAFDAAAAALLHADGALLRAFSPQDVSLLLWSFAALSQPAPELFMAARARTLGAFSPEAQTRERGDHDDNRIGGSFVRHAAAAPGSSSGGEGAEGRGVPVSRWSAREISMTLWAFAVFDLADTRLVRAMTAAMPPVSRRTRAAMDPIVATQLFQAGVSAERQAGGGVLGEAAALPPSVLQAARAHWAAQTARGYRRSSLQASVAAAAARLGLRATLEWAAPGGLLSVDIMVDTPHGMEPVAVEVNGPSHYSTDCANGTHRPTGATDLRLRLLAPAVGGRLVCVPFYEWNALEGDADRQTEYLRRLLKPYKGTS